MSRSIFRFLSFFLLTVAVLTVAGCKKDVKPAGLPKLYSCTITILQAGEPLPEAFVSLISTDGQNTRWPVGGTTDQSGKAVLGTYGKFKGVPKGEWKVVVTKNIVEDDNGNIVVPPKFEPGQRIEMPKAPRLVNEVSIVPDEYRSAETTTLTLSVQGKTATEFDLGEKVHTFICRTQVGY